MINKNDNRIKLSDCMNFYSSIDIKIITLIAEKGLQQYYDAMKEFYSEIFFDEQYDAIVFDDKTSINMAEIFLVILWNEASLLEKEKLEKNWSKFMTYNAYLEKFGQTEADYFNVGKYSKILVVDDMTTHGNTLNELLDKIVNSRKSVLDNLYVKSFVQLNYRNLLGMKYYLKIKFKRTFEFGEYYNLIHRIFTVISMVGKVNKSLVAPIEIPTKDFDSTKNDLGKSLGFEMTTISREEGNIFERCYYGYTHKDMKYYFSIRAIRNCYTNKYRLIPFVYMPALSSTSYDKLKQRIFKKWGISDLSISSQLEYDLVQTYLSQSLLFSVLGGANIKLDIDDYDMTKMAINFGLNQNTSKIDLEYFRRLSNPEYLFSFEELKNCLHEATIDMPPSIDLGKGDNNFYTAMQDCIYGLRIQEQTESFRRANNLLPLDDKTLATNRKNNWNFTLLDFIKQIAKEDKASSSHELITSLLLLSDLGYINLGSKVVGDNCERQYLQTIRMNNYAISILPKRYEMYNFILDHMCHSYYGVGDENLEDELKLLLKKAQEKGIISQEVDIFLLVKNLISYYGIIKQSFQALNYWNEDFDVNIPSWHLDSSEYRTLHNESLRKKLELVRKKKILFSSWYNKDYK